MPTKRNKAGNQQNYVPAGNGNASGEYGDNATGSNKHFTNFAKPQNPNTPATTETTGTTPATTTPTTPATPPATTLVSPPESENQAGVETETETETQTPDTQKEDKTKTTILNKITDDKVKNHFEKIYDTLTDEGRKVFDNAIEKFGDKLPEIKLNDNGSFYSPGGIYGHTINIDESSFNRGWEHEGQTFIHEFTHWITHNLTIPIEHDVRVSYFSKDTVRRVDDYRIGLAPIFNGQSLTDIIREEAKSLNRKSTIIDGLRSERTNAINNYMKEKTNGKDADDMNLLGYKIKNSDWYKNEKNNLVNLYSSRKISYEEATKRLNGLLDRMSSEGIMTNEVKEFQELNKFYTEGVDKWAYDSGIAVISDALSGNTYRGGRSGFGFGHDPSYYKSAKTYDGEETNENYSDEFTSNMMSAIATGNTNVIEATKKYMPKSYEAFMQLYNKYYLGKDE